MNKFDFEASVRETIYEALADVLVALDSYTPEELEDLDPDDYRDELWSDDSIVGCRCSTWDAEEHLCHNMDLLEEAMIEFGSDFSNGWNAKEAESIVREYTFLNIYDATFEDYITDATS